ncbi:glycosyltransferase family 4 protein [Micromonospora thermarum]|uniref:Glycosyltransferase family 4 protein n=1 Tax=Micromonospora thermarum TaxID=2720024 RepID=A0ABX0ZEM0_9ACTN|nr:glycosyltransferase family 4 protein [Micromonospora thermarum]NJP34365.1 glycosyltransferase family 4 protein [Micromonospora thermarum]
MTGTVHAVLPGDIDDPATPSGGNRYDRRVLGGLAAAGWTVHEHPVPGGWPHPEPADRAGLARVLDALPDGTVALLDGLVASAVPEVLAPRAGRLRLVVLVHLPLDHDAERAALGCAAAVVTTSGWTRRWLIDRYALPAGRIHVATPGVDPAPPAPDSATGGELLCVAAVTPLKGHDTLVDALARVADLPWRCVCAGSLTRDPAFVDRLRRRVADQGLAGRVHLAGPYAGAELDAAYAAADLLVLASRIETYGMAVTEALARGVPVLATATGGLPDTLGRAPDGTPPGLLVPPGDPAALAGALRRWLTDPALRGRLRRAAHERRATLDDWTTTTTALATALRGAA